MGSASSNLRVEAYCDAAPLHSWLTPAEVRELADNQLDWALTEEGNRLDPFVFRVVRGLDNVSQLGDCTLQLRKPGSGRQTIRFREYHQDRRRGPAAPPPRPAPPQPRASPVKRIVIVHDGENCPIPPVQPQLDAQGRFLVANGRPVPEPGEVPVQFHALYDLVLERIIQLAYHPAPAPRVDVRAVPVEWWFVHSHGTRPEWMPSYGSRNDMSARSIRFENVGQVDTKVLSLLNSIRRAWGMDPSRPNPEEGLIFALLSGNRDFSHEIQALREGDPFPVCLIYPKGQAAESFRKMFSGRDAGCWQELISLSRPRGVRPGPAHGPARSTTPSGGTETKHITPGPAHARSTTPSGPAHAPTRSTTPSGPRSPLHSTPSGYGVSYKLWFFLSNPDHAAALEEKLCLPPGSVTLDRASKKVKAEGCRDDEETFRKKAEEFEKSLLKEELKMPGFSPQELRNNVDLTSLALEKKVCYLVPDQITLQPFQLLVSFKDKMIPWNEAKIISWCKDNFDVVISQVKDIQGHLVAYIGRESPNDEAKAKLTKQSQIPQLCFSDGAGPPATPASQPEQKIGKHQLWMHGTIHESVVRGLCEKHAATLFQYKKTSPTLALLTLDPKKNKNLEEIKKKLLDSPACFLMIFQKGLQWQEVLKQAGFPELLSSVKLGAPGMMNLFVSDPEKINKLATWKNPQVASFQLLSYFSLSQTLTSTSTTSRSSASQPLDQTVFLLSLPGKGQEQNVRALEDKIRSMVQADRQLKLCDLVRPASSPSPTSTSAADKSEAEFEAKVKEALCIRSWQWVKKFFPATAVLDTKGSTVQLKGSGEEVQKTEDLLRDRISKIKVGKPYNIEKAWSQQLARLLKSTLRDLTEKSTDERAVEMEFNWKKGTFQLACWDSLEDTAFEEIQQSLVEYCKSYMETEWNLAYAAKEMNTSEDAIKSRLKELGDGEIREQTKDSGVDHYEWERRTQTLKLWGSEERVKAALTSMNDLCKPEKQVTHTVKPEHRLVWLLKHPRHKAVLDELRQECNTLKAASRGLDVSIDDPTKKAQGTNESPNGIKEKTAFITIKGKQQQANDAKKKLEDWFRRLPSKLTFKEVSFPAKGLESAYLANKASEVKLHRVAAASGSWFERVEASSNSISSSSGGSSGGGGGSGPQATRNPALLARAQVGDCMVEVWQGNILENEPEVECVVNPAPRDLFTRDSTVNGLAGAIRSSGGQALLVECANLLQQLQPKELEYGEVVCSGAHELHQKMFEHILHARVRGQVKDSDNESFMKSLVIKILKTADEKGILSLSMPLIGTGKLGWPQDKVSSLILDSIIEWKGQGGLGNLSRIIIMDMDEQKAKMFAEDVEARPELEESSWEDSACTDQLKLEFSSFDPKCNDFAEKRLMDTLKSLAQDKKLPNRGGIQLETGETLPEALSEFEEYVVLQKSIPLQATCEGEEGQEKVVLRAYDSNHLDMAEVLLESWNAIRVAAQAQVKYPKEWPDNADTLDEARTTEVDPVNDAEEFKMVLTTMRNETGPNIPNVVRRENTFKKKIVKVERIINPPLWRDYSSFCRSLRHRGPVNEVWTKHGTGKVEPKQVYSSLHGMDRNYSKIATTDKCGNLWGQAVYTAENAFYADQPKYCYQGPDGFKQMLLCKFAAGNVYSPEGPYTRDRRETRNPPEGHDSIRGWVMKGAVDDFFAMMSYRDNQVYPYYLVTYHPTEEEEG